MMMIPPAHGTPCTVCRGQGSIPPRRWSLAWLLREDADDCPECSGHGLVESPVATPAIAYGRWAEDDR
jgi:hypothetical protein